MIRLFNEQKQLMLNIHVHQISMNYIWFSYDVTRLKEFIQLGIMISREVKCNARACHV